MKKPNQIERNHSRGSSTSQGKKPETKRIRVTTSLALKEAVQTAAKGRKQSVSKFAEEAVRKDCAAGKQAAKADGADPITIVATPQTGLPGVIYKKRVVQTGRFNWNPSEFEEALSQGRVEEEANYFASNLLMPQDRVTKLISPDRVSVAISDIELLQRAFRVSFQSAAIRVVQTVQYTKCAGVMRKSDGKVWYVVGPALRTAGYQYLQRDYSLLPRDCATCLCVSSDQIAEIPRSFQCATTASCWFHGVRPGSSRDMLLDEHAVRLGQHGVFTLLTEHKMKTKLS